MILFFAFSGYSLPIILSITQLVSVSCTFSVAGANGLTQVIDHCLNKRLLHMFRVTDTDFFPSFSVCKPIGS